MQCFEMLRESMKERYKVTLELETMEIYIDGEKFQGFYERFNEIKNAQMFIEYCVEGVLMVG